MNTNEKLNELQEEAPKLDWIKSNIKIKQLSKDFHWFSPILAIQLANKKAELVVKPKNESELKELISICSKLKINLTIRGGGTGNYGQAVPLYGGVLIDMSDYKVIHSLSKLDGIAYVQSGIKLADLEDAAKSEGWELRCMPSTYKMATLGGLFSGGFGGIGSINYGPVAAPGTIMSIRVMTISEEPEILEIRGPELIDFHHTYGTNGIVIDIEIALAPAREWDEYLISFNTLEQALDFSKSIANSSAIDTRNIALFDAYSASHFEQTPSDLSPFKYIVIVIIASNGIHAMFDSIASHDGYVEWSQTAEQMNSSKQTLMECCWNHSTLHALKYNKQLTYLQTQYDVVRVAEQLLSIKKDTNNETQIHLEFIRMSDSALTIVGLPLIHYENEDRLIEIVKIHNKHGVSINNPHVYTLEDGKHKGCFNNSILESKRKNDPLNLLNVGKIRTL